MSQFWCSSRRSWKPKSTLPPRSLSARAPARWARRAEPMAAATSLGEEVSQLASGAPLIGEYVTAWGADAEATTVLARRRTSLTSTAYVAVGSSSGIGNGVGHYSRVRTGPGPREGAMRRPPVRAHHRTRAWWNGVMATTAFKGSPSTTGDLPAEARPLRPSGWSAPTSLRRGARGASRRPQHLPERRHGVCATACRRFNGARCRARQHLGHLRERISPSRSVASRWCRGIENVTAASAFGDFGTDYGVTMTDGPLAGLLARSWSSSAGRLTRSSTITRPRDHHRPDYDAAVAALGWSPS